MACSRVNLPLPLSLPFTFKSQNIANVIPKPPEVLLQWHRYWTFSFVSVWLKRHDVSVAISTAIITYNNTHCVRDTTWSQAGHSPASPAGARVQTQGSPHRICGRLRGNGTGYCPVILFSPVSIIPSILYTQSFIYDQNYVTLTTDSVIKWYTQSQNSDRNFMSISTNQTSSWNVQYHKTTLLHTDRNITAQWHELISVTKHELFR
jgi:hypothetical protein